MLLIKLAVVTIVMSVGSAVSLTIKEHVNK